LALELVESQAFPKGITIHGANDAAAASATLDITFGAQPAIRIGHC
jgi:hypothetical protein